MFGIGRRSFGSSDGRESTADDQDDPRASAPAPMARAKSIIGEKDSREQVADARTAPFSQIGLIYGYNSTRGRATAAGTGWLISPDTMVTAAHNVYNREAYRRANKYRPAVVKVWLGYNDDDRPPYGVRRASEIFVHEDYIRDRTKLEFDIAVIKLDQPVEKRHGWLQIVGSSVNISKTPLGLAGFPSDIQRQPLKMFYAYGAMVSIEGNKIIHNIDSATGQSGGPILAPHGGLHSDDVRVVGVHTQGKEAAARLGLIGNMGLLLKGDMLEWINQHI